MAFLLGVGAGFLAAMLEVAVVLSVVLLAVGGVRGLCDVLAILILVLGVEERFPFGFSAMVGDVESEFR